MSGQSDASIRVGLIGAGKFGAMFLSQAPTTPGLTVTAIADLDEDAVRRTCRAVGWDGERISKVAFADTGEAIVQRDDVDVVVEATGHASAGLGHALAAIEAEKHVVMVNVEADVLAGPALAARARDKGVVYSMAYGDQPALTIEMIEWAEMCGFRVVAAGKGTKYLPEYHTVTPDDVWSHYGLSPREAAEAGMNPKMFNSFLDGTKSAIEMAAVANGTRLAVPETGLGFPPCGTDDLATVLRPRSAGGTLARSGMVEVVSSLKRDGSPVSRDLRWGVYVVIEAPNAYSASCFRQYGLMTDRTGRYAATFKPFHLIGMELNVSIFRAARDNRPTGSSSAFRGDVVSIAKRDLAAGEVLDGEGGYTVYGKLVPAKRSIDGRCLPIGLAQDVRLTRPVQAGQIVTDADVEPDKVSTATSLRAETVALLVGGT